LSAGHELSSFQNGKHASLDEWLRNRARTSEGMSARTYVVCDALMPARVVGYYAISTAMEQRIALPNAKLRRSMPDHIPLLLIGRLAVDRAFQGLGLGGDLLADAIARGILAHAIDGDAASFYQRHGFSSSPLGERVMLLPIETARAMLRD
jgi:GNAT superfamily N-acetyltransferase